MSLFGNPVGFASSETSLLLSGGTMAGSIDMNGNLMTGLADPVDDADAAHKSYVDSGDASTLASANDYADSAAGSAESRAKSYAASLMSSGAGSSSGNFDLGSYRVINLGAPINNTDGANKKYVDDTAVSAAEDAADSALASAKTYASSVANTAQTNARSYAATVASTAETNAKSYADTVAEEAESNAKTYASSLFSSISGSSSGNFDMNSYRVINLGAPINNTDGANKKYVDDTAASAAEDAADSALASAKTYASSVASTAETNAKSYADTVAEEAESNAKTYASSVASAAQDNANAYTDGLITEASVTLSASGWSNKKQTVSVASSGKSVIVTPAPATWTAYTEAGVYCSAKTNTTLTFTCEEVPTSSVTANLILFRKVTA